MRPFASISQVGVIVAEAGLGGALVRIGALLGSQGGDHLGAVVRVFWYIALVH